MRDDAADRLLRDYLTATADAEVEQHLTSILEEVAKPIIRPIVLSALRGPATAEDADDLVSEALIHLLRRLRGLRGDAAATIEDLRGYIATCAYNCCHERLRERYPARNRLRNHLRYLFSHHPKLGLWSLPDCRHVCGLREWVGQEPASADRLEELKLPARSDPAAEDRAQIAGLVMATLTHVGRPLDLDKVIDAIARMIHLEQHRVELAAANEVDRGAGPDSALELRMTLRDLWDDIRKLVPRQRTALLLNLRDTHGREILSLLPHTRTASITDIADAMEMPIAEFATLWNELPLGDAAIARIIGASPQQVIKLRRLARERLRRLTRRREQPATVRKHQKLAPESPSAIQGAKKPGGSTAQ